MADLQDIVDDLEAEIRRPISVEDRRWRLLAHSAQPDETDAVRRCVDPDARDRRPTWSPGSRGSGCSGRATSSTCRRTTALGMTRRGVLPIRHGDVLLGFLWVIVGDQPLTDAERAATRARRRGGGGQPVGPPARGRRAPRRRINALLAQAFAGEPVAADLAATLRWPRDGRFAVAVCAAATRLAERLRRRRGAADFAWLAQDDRVVILARDPAPSWRRAR